MESGGLSRLQRNLNSNWHEKLQQGVEGVTVGLTLDLCGRDLTSAGYPEADLHVPSSCTLRNGVLLIPRFGTVSMDMWGSGAGDSIQMACVFSSLGAPRKGEIQMYLICSTSSSSFR